MFYVYVLRSEKDGKLYTGSTKDLVKRESLHQLGKVISTRYRKPFILIYYEACLNETDARKRERFLKSGPGKRFIKGRLKYYFKAPGPVKSSVFDF